jgi:hypothetical protein
MMLAPDRRPKDTCNGIQLTIMDFVIQLVARIVVPLFFLGMAGSAVVVVVSFVGDLKELFSDDE